MRTFPKIGLACGLLLGACDRNEQEENLLVQADALEIAANAAADPAQAQVLRNEANSLREAARNGAQVDTEGSVTVIKE